MAKQEGKLNKVFILGKSETGSWSVDNRIEGQTESSLNISNSLTNIQSSKDDAAGWQENMDGQKSWNIDVTFYKQNGTDDHTSQDKLYTLMLSSNTGVYAIQGEWKTETSGGSSVSKFYGWGGKCKIASLNTSFPQEGAISAQASLQGDGQVLDFTAGKTAQELKTALEAL